MRISVVIPSWRRPDSLARCLVGFQVQDQPPDEVLIVVREGDTATHTLLSETCAEEFGLRVITLRVPGVVAALNAGLEAAQGDIISMTDDDAVPRPDWLRRIADHFQGDSAVGGVGGRDWVHHGAELEAGTASTVGRVRWYGRLVGNHHLGDGGPREVDVLKGVNMSYRRSAIEDIGFDERIRGSGAQVHFEVPLSLAVKHAGWKLVYDPAVAVDHYPAERFDGNERHNPSLEALSNAVHNETYALLKWLPWWRKLLAFVYGLAVGTRLAPGLFLAAGQCFRESDRMDVGRRFLASARARLDGLQTFRLSSR